MANLESTNEWKIVGTLIGVEQKCGVSKRNGHNWISITATVKAVLNDVENTFKVRFFTTDTKANGEKNKRYDKYLNLEHDFKGRKVERTGSIAENRFMGRDGQRHTSNQLNGKFRNITSDSKADEATFSVGGFLVATPAERRNKDNELYGYRVEIGQANYKGDNRQDIVLDIDPKDTIVLNGINNYKIGDTIIRNGRRSSVEKTNTVEEKVAFGEPIVRTFTSHFNNYFITGGKAPITNEADGRYSSETIHALIAAYKASKALFQQEHSGEKAAEDETVAESKAPARPVATQSSLI
nr:MAG TPA: hypothetical protein [Caudoviricetes sp.]